MKTDTIYTKRTLVNASSLNPRANPRRDEFT